MAGFVIAVDGPAASGKGTIAARLGEAFVLPVLDSGLLYRAVGLAALAIAADLDDADACAAAARGVDLSHLEDPALRTRSAARAASCVAVHPGVRQALVAFQRAFAGRETGAVIDGRDIGTVIVPDAPAKLYVSADATVRARRRWRQLAAEGEVIAFAEVLADIEARDRRDGERQASPMRAAPDAVLLDTTDLDIDRAFDAARRIVETARARWSNPDG